MCWLWLGVEADSQVTRSVDGEVRVLPATIRSSLPEPAADEGTVRATSYVSVKSMPNAYEAATTEQAQPMEGPPQTHCRGATRFAGGHGQSDPEQAIGPDDEEWQ